MTKEPNEPSVKLPMDEFVRNIAGLAGRAGAREVIDETKIIPRLEAVEYGLVSLRISRGKIAGIAAGVLGFSGVIVLIVKLFRI